jgi:protein-S-isoprenylcysteine O-methyltransferase Ste14
VQTRSRSAICRAYSAGSYAVFLVASLWGVTFLADLGPTPVVDSSRSGPAWVAVLVDLGLWAVFGLQHSLMARPHVKSWLSRVLPGRAERSTYVLTAGLALGLLFWQWRALPGSIWQVHTQPWVALIWVVYGAGWAIAIAATFMIDHGEFLGLRQSGWLTPQPQLPAVSQRWLYSSVRHPMMVGLGVAFWATPAMTAGHLLFALAASGYIAVGVRFEERDLRRRLGTAYDDYARRVPRFVPKPDAMTLRDRTKAGFQRSEGSSATAREHDVLNPQQRGSGT